MSEQLQKIDRGQLAAIFGNIAPDVNDSFSAGISAGDYLPNISIRGKEWRLVINGEQQRMTDRHLDVYLVNARQNVSKTFYQSQWSGGQEAAAPDCASSDGIRPDSGVKNQQANSCQVCPHNAWGSKITAGGKKGKSCADYKLIVVALAAKPDMVFQLRIPAASLKPLGAYVKKLNMLGVPVNGAVTRLTFADTEYPQIEFNMNGTVGSKEEYDYLKEIGNRDDVLSTLQNSQPVAQLAETVHAAHQPVVVQAPTQPAAAAQTFANAPVSSENASAPNQPTPSTEQQALSPADIIAKWGGNK